MRLRIGVDGAQGTGKTNLLARLRRHFAEKFEYIPEAARTIAPAFGVCTDADWPTLLGDKPRLEAFFNAEQEWVIAHEDSAGSFMIDSSLWVVAAYREYFACRPGITVAVSRTYDLILHCGPSGPLVKDGFRFAEGQLQVDECYRRLVRHSFQGSIVFLPSGESRISRAIESIERLGASLPAPDPQHG